MNQIDRRERINSESVRSETILKIEREQERYKAMYDKKKYLGATYSVGEIVVVKPNPVSTGESTKFQAKYKGPFVVTPILSGDTYRIRRLEDLDKNSSKASTTAHVSQIEGYRNPNESENQSDGNEEESLTTDERPANEIQRAAALSEEKPAEVEREVCESVPIPTSEIEESTRPKRTIRAPKRFDDFV